MVSVRRLLATGGAAVAGPMLVLVLGAPAMATVGNPVGDPSTSDPGAPSPTTGTPGLSTGASGGTGGGSDTRGGCAVVAGPSYLGVSCGGAADRGGQTVKEILGPDPVPGCWDEPVSQEDLANMGRQNDADHTWYWERCLTGIDSKTKTVEKGGIKIDVQLVNIPDPSKVKTLTTRQNDLVEGYEKTAGVPPPLAAVTPSLHPHVGQWVSIVDTTGHEVDVDPVDGVQLRARLTSIDVEPLGTGKGTISCDGAGVVAKADDAPSGADALSRDPFGYDPDGCWYKYLHSSIDERNEAYPVNLTAHWTAETSVAGGAWVHLADFTKSQITDIPVTEIQTLVVD